MNMLEKKIVEKIKGGGPITFKQFMEMSLYDPEYGYYASRKMKIGREGDYYTSSHLHPVFGALVGKQVLDMWKLMGKLKDFKIIEIGAGAGYVCKDMLDSLKKTEFFDSINYIIIELNPEVMDKQKSLLSEFSHKVQWFSTLSQVGNIRGCIFSNELIDAFPVHLVQMDGELKEIYVTIGKETFEEERGPLSTDAISEYFTENSIELEKKYKTEVNLKIKDFLNDINNSLTEGFVMSIDYGYSARDYYNEDRNRGTLMCYHRHQLSENPYQNVGEQDITAHVNFSSVKHWGDNIGLQTLGFCSQGAFLVSLGIDVEIKRLSTASDDYLFELARIKKLILPEGMGDSHKVIIQYKGDTPKKLKGFSISNRIKSLI
jgi:SAM-dependent MidA family methyltransferase